ncbi:restriction endonuclease [Deinococcus sp.]|uniref:restriction endonuclease n=1 Tax=Deinococcus sp. TaxID=47478 RepID=UPI0025BF57CC|nr:restriction endonuclease [Deinococcus sp.]
MRNTMPSFDEFNALTLKFMGDGVARQVNQIKDAVTELAQLSPEALAERIPSGEPKVRHRITWACSNLYRAGFLVKPQRGVYQISETGRQILPMVSTTLTETVFETQPRWQKYLAERRQRQSARGDASQVVTVLPQTEEQDPENAAITAVDKLNDDLAVELLRRLREGSPAFFERAVIRVLWAMGYGGKDERELATLLSKSHTGRSSDGGIDGIIKLDPLGVQNIYIQAKRYGEGKSVGRPEVQGFVGALHGKRATRGVFITTSRYTPDAKAYAEGEAQDRVVLVDGVQLTTLMLSYGVGVQPKQTLTLLEIDEDFFE